MNNVRRIELESFVSVVFINKTYIYIRQIRNIKRKDKYIWRRKETGPFLT